MLIVAVTISLYDLVYIEECEVILQYWVKIRMALVVVFYYIFIYLMYLKLFDIAFSIILVRSCDKETFCKFQIHWEL